MASSYTVPVYTYIFTIFWQAPLRQISSSAFRFAPTIHRVYPKPERRKGGGSWLRYVTMNLNMCSRYRIKYVIERHADVERYCGKASAGGNCAAIILHHNRSLDPVFVRVLLVRRVALVAVTISRPHSQVTSSSVARCAFFSPCFSGVVGAKRRKTDVTDEVIRGDVRTVETVTRWWLSGFRQRSRKLELDVRRCQCTYSQHDGQHLDHFLWKQMLTKI